MKCTICERQVGANALPTICWWCKQQLRITDERDEIVPPSEQLEFKLEPPKNPKDGVQ